VRIVVNGQQAFGKSVLEKILEKGTDEVVAVYGPADKPGARPDPLVAFAREKGLRVETPASFKDPAEWEKLAAMTPDLGVMAFVTKICPSGFLNVPTKGTIQYHPSLLPRHRGPSSINWPIIQGETKTGLTIFWPDDGLDTGPILLQKSTEIGADDTLGTVYFDRLYPMGVAAMMEAIELVRAGTAPCVVQDESRATYEGWCRAENVEIDWSRPFADVHNLIRGADPQPGAWTTVAGRKLALYEPKRITGEAGAPGTVVALDDKTVTIAAAGGAVRIGRARPEGDQKIAAAEAAAKLGLKAGSKLG
jgi:methionyl-tRNA formyltransferase